jgi:hypothetical protein
LSNVKGLSKAVMMVVAIVVIGGAATGLFLLFTAPQPVVNFTVAFTIGADVERREFNVPLLHDAVQIEVVVNSGNLLWTARILEHEDVVWSHNAHQAGQTTYQSEWIPLPSGKYNFTFATAGIGSLDAEITVTSKGGIW